MLPRVLTPRPVSCTWSRPRQWLSGQWKKYEVHRGALVVRFVGKRWWGLTAYELVKGGECRPLLGGFTTYEALIEMKKKQFGTGPSGPVHLAAMESDLFSKMPSLMSHMATLRYDDGDPRKPGEIRLRPAGALWMAEALDYDSRAMLQSVTAMLDDSLAGLALLLESEDAPWQLCPWMKAPPEPKKKK